MRPRHPLVPLIAALVLARIALPLVALDATWEWHRDELLYAAMGDHLDWFRMQFPPLVPAVTGLGRAAFGESVWAARVPAALAGGATLLAMLLAVRTLGGGTWALVVTAIGSAAAPLFVRASVLLQPVVFDQLWCTAALVAVVCALVHDAPRWWVVAGLCFGLGTLTKLSAPLYGAVAFLATLAVPGARVQLRTRWPWCGALVAVLTGSATITGQVAHGWPFVAQMRALRAQQLVHVRATAYLGEQPMLLAAATILVAGALWWAVRGGRAAHGSPTEAAGPVVAERTASRRHLAVRWLATFAALLVGWYLVMRGKAYYAGPAYPLLIAAGAVALESLQGRVLRPVARLAVPALLLVTGAILLPLGVPALPPAAMARYAARFGPSTTNVGALLPLPQDYADMLGWRAQVDGVAHVWAQLPPADRARAGIAASNYGQAGALALYGPARGLPYPVSPVGDFWAWGPGPTDGTLWLVVVSEPPPPELGQLWRDVRVGAVLRDPRRVPEEQVVSIMIARDLRIPLREFWRRAGPRWG